ncbi:MAG: aminotransferase class V-fold PLP-dependent enzyme [Deltaproteobacteria bacterium]|nr:aminotransferase class V-fold PLP-dependent enzyme [Deltaproteobacteria bacterium]NCP01992.1 aminotransferase class V-fold PLP-dependent enzyme [Deltaproteobacteria bacterium]NCP78286.1 aminotransferase class V-fold PLP-dependent enzyme [Desulfuromonadales bacterium]
MSAHGYFDNAATSHPKPEAVYRRTLAALRSGGNAGRGAHAASFGAERLIFNARETLAQYFGVADSSRIVFTPNATTAINTALFGVLKPGDRVVTSCMEHNAVTRPLRRLADLGVKVVRVAGDAAGRVAPAALQQACTAAPTRMLVLNHCSNVNGQLQQIEGLGPFCRQHNILFLLDASQSAGTFPLDLDAEQIDLFAAAGHKNLLGPSGTGLLYLRPGLEIEPLIYGGTGANSHSDLSPDALPERLESGTLNLPGIAGLMAGVAYLQQQGQNHLRQQMEHKLGQLIAGLRDIAGLKLYSADRLSHQGDAVSFTLAQSDPAEIGFRLNQEYGISVRVGLHCAPDAHRSLGSFPLGTVRVSPGIFTREADIESLLVAVRAIADAR